MARKSAAPDSFRLLVNPFRKISPATCCDTPKKCNSRQPSAFGQSPAKSPVSLRRFTPKKTFRPDRLRLLVNPLQKVSLAFGDMPRKNVETRQPSTFGQFLAKSLASVRRYAPKKRSRQIAFGFWSIPYKKPLQRPEMYLEKIFRSDCLRLLVDPLRKASPAFGDIPRKNVYARPLPAAFSYRP